LDTKPISESSVKWKSSLFVGKFEQYLSAQIAWREFSQGESLAEGMKMVKSFGWR